VGRILGSILWPSFITVLLEALRVFMCFWEFEIGVLFLFAIIFFTRGLAGILENWFPSIKERRHGP